MKKNDLCLVLVAVSIIVLSISAFAQRDYKWEDIPVTRWLDTTTTPMTFEEYNQSRHFAETDNIRIVRQPTITVGIPIDIIVNEDLYPLIETSLDTFFYDLQLDGYALNIYTAAETFSPISLRELLYTDWSQQMIEGVIFIGDLAVPWYEMYEPEDWGGAYVSFPCDLYFMDLNGNWGDSNTNGMFDSHSGALEADIWCGRLMASTLTYHDSDEIGRMQNYFRKNHDYRKGDLRLTDHALAFIDNDWHTYGWGFDVANSYPSTDSVVDIYETNRDNYRDMLRQSSDSLYEHVLICSHSSPSAHYIYYDINNYQLFYDSDIETYMMQSLTWNLFACSNARYIESNNMGAWYIFEQDYGLLSIGSSKTGSMLCFDEFYRPLGNGITYGEAFLIWAQNDMENCAGDASRAWFYGMCIQGDPTLRLSRFQPPLNYCQYLPGDINGDGIVIGSDITYGVQYFRGVGSCPPDSCYDYENERWVYVAADANGNCDFLGSDITYMVRYFRGLYDEVSHCPDFPLDEE